MTGTGLAPKAVEAGELDRVGALDELPGGDREGGGVARAEAVAVPLPVDLAERGAVELHRYPAPRRTRFGSRLSPSRRCSWAGTPCCRQPGASFGRGRDETARAISTTQREQGGMFTMLN